MNSQRRLTGAWLATALAAALSAALVPTSAVAADAVLVIGHAALPKLDEGQLQRLYTGRAIEVGGIPVVAVNAPDGSALRQRFLATYLQQDDERYRAYWTVRKHVGKGAPPPQLATAAEVISLVQRQPGAIGYIDASDLRPGLNVLARP